MRKIDVAAGVLFTVFMLLPGLSLAALGYSQWAERPPRWNSIDYRALVASSDGYRRDTMARILTFSPVGMASVFFKSYLDYRVFGFINSSKVISGRGDWLFFKSQFRDGKCRDPKDTARALHRTVAMQDLAAGIGIDLRFSVSPDKSVVYPDQLGARAGAFAGCKQESAYRWRVLARTINPELIDHYQAIAPYSRDQDLYFHTDTHWNPLGISYAMRQLAMAYVGRQPPPPTKGHLKHASRSTDLMRLLRIDDVENFQLLKGYWRGPFREAFEEKLSGTMIIHDSFYNAARLPLKIMFGDYIGLNLNKKIKEGVWKKLPRRILVNSVERGFFGRVLKSRFSWNSALGRAVVAHNMKAAAACTGAPLDDVRLSRITETATGLLAKKNSQILFRLPEGGKPCFRISYKTDSKSPAQLFLPVRGNSGDGFEPGMSIDFTDVGSNRALAIVLPESYAGRTVRLDPIINPGKISGFKIRAGTM